MEDFDDSRLNLIARRRAHVRKSVYSYIVVIFILWLIWWFTEGVRTGFTGYPWPIWLMLGWGLSIGKQYYNLVQITKKNGLNSKI